MPRAGCPVAEEQRACLHVCVTCRPDGGTGDASGAVPGRQLHDAAAALLCRLIRGAGFVPAQRDNVYDVLKIHDGPESPDLRVTDWSEHRVRKLHRQAAQPAAASLTVSAK